MIILDTNVISEIIRDRPDIIVVEWLNSMNYRELCTTAVNIFEIEFGLSMLPNGRKRDHLKNQFNTIAKPDLCQAVLPFTNDAAQRAAVLRAERKRHGLIIDLPDTMIAGIAIANRAAIATRNVKHFSDLPIQVIDPWRG